MKSPIYVWTRSQITLLERDLLRKITCWEFLPAGKSVDLMLPDGSKISYKGIKFSGSPLLVFWSPFINPFLIEGITRTLSSVTAKARQSGALADPCIREAAEMLEGVIEHVYSHLLRTVAAKQEARLKAVESSAESLSDAIQKEAARFLPHLYFDSQPPATG